MANNVFKVVLEIQASTKINPQFIMWPDLLDGSGLKVEDWKIINNDMEESMQNNSMHVIYPKRSQYGIWTFTDESVGLVDEPFVGAINLFIDYMVKDLDNPQNGFPLYFSEIPFPNKVMTLRKQYNTEGGGAVYSIDELNGAEGWLCPATLKYFKDYPEVFYVGI